ncbi:hypothetical protein OIDMADRAFT_34792 [Oidiodendron maius Zn]|uniref:Uncharacterized protein n=1 Tax=Oidiodendron maius (strain Zn) TaxID=913774 RepID=A0A0C3C7A9_OIDMZ|nr:hypothetical protein OIDMADRAFT_34792 [Oidiodendron maius Zn]
MEMLISGYGLLSTQSYLKLLTVRDPANTNAPGLQGNKNGPPGPQGNQKGPPRHAVSTEDPPTPPSSSSSPAIVIPPPPSSSSSAIVTPPPATTSPSSTSSALSTASISSSSPDHASSTVIVTSTSISSISFLTPSAPSLSTVISFTAPDIGTSNDDISSTATSLVSAPSSSGPVLLTISPGEMTLQTTFASPLMISGAPNDTFRFESNRISPGQRAGISIAAIVIFFLCKRYKVKLPETLRHIFGNFGGPCCLSRGKTTDTQHDSVLEAEVNANDNMYWNYRETFARPTVIQKARRSLHKSLTGLRRVNPLGLNPVQTRTTWTATPSRRSEVAYRFAPDPLSKRTAQPTSALY